MTFHLLFTVTAQCSWSFLISTQEQVSACGYHTSRLPKTQPPWSHMSTSCLKDWGHPRQEDHMLYQGAALPGSSGGGQPQTDMSRVVAIPWSSVLYFLQCPCREESPINSTPQVVCHSLTTLAQDPKDSGSQTLFGSRTPGSITKCLRRNLGTDWWGSWMSRGT